MKKISYSDATIFRRGFYSCPEERREEVNEYLEMARKISPQSEAIYKKETFRKRRVQKKVKVIRRSLRKAISISRRCQPSHPTSRQ